VSVYTYNPAAPRITKTKLATRLGAPIERGLQVISILFIAGALVLGITGHHQALSLAGVSVIMIVTLIWIRRDLRVLPAEVIGKSAALDSLLPTEIVTAYSPTMSAKELWEMLKTTGDAHFLMVRYLLTADDIDVALTDWRLDQNQLWDEASQICQKMGLHRLSSASAVCALFHLCPGLSTLLTSYKLSTEDLDEGAHWIARLKAYHLSSRPLYGGIARDWAAGFTPLLQQFGTNLSSQVELSNKYFVTQERTNQLDALITGLDSASGSVVLIGEPGIGKSALLYGLADQVLQGKAPSSLAHHQIIALSASAIVATSGGPGDIENIVLSLFSEAAKAGNIIIALDEAQLFFGQGTGAVNLSQILLPILQARGIKLTLAITPGDWQRLRAMNTSMSSLLTPIVLVEPSQAEVLRILADRALLLERACTTTWSAVQESYRLSGRYFQDEAYPGRALKLLEAAISHPEGNFITERSVQQAIESQFGVKVQQVSGVESDTLLHLEDHIHERMINQTRAVSVVANALRRARAGVSNPKRPIGSFLFLGPTGVGKTELAKSLAALYFGAESNVIRLDMSEYQQITDVERILASGADNPEGLLSKVRQSPFSVVLFDEIEKAHANVLNLLLQLLDEGNLTDTKGRATSFKDAIIIATSNAGADEIRRHIEAGEQLEAFEADFTNSLIDAGSFKPELLNRFDEIVLFRPLNQTELTQVVKLMVAEVNQTLQAQKIAVVLTDDAAASLVSAGYDPRLGARPMRRMVTRTVEDTVAAMILRGEARPGDTVTLNSERLGLTTENPVIPPPA
jgi:ATP-dependent Clp protease ATP-binding subunit ClpC